MSTRIDERQINCLLNLTTICLGILIILMILKPKKRELDDLSSYDWDCFDFKQVVYKEPTVRKRVWKDNSASRIKINHKDTITIKEEHKFHLNNNTKEPETQQFLSIIEGRKLQDMINYVSSIRMIEDDPCSVENMYAYVQENLIEASVYNINTLIDNEILKILGR